MDGLIREVRFACRSLRRDRGVTVPAILALALGIGASTVVFSVVYNLLFNGLAARDAGRLVVPIVSNASMRQFAGVDFNPTFNLQDALEIRERNHVFEDMAAYAPMTNVVYSDGHEVRQTTGAAVTANAFDFYGVAPLIGRGITLEDGKPGAEAVFVLAYAAWNAEFNRDATIIGRVFTVNGAQRTLVGIMPPRFQAFGAQIWMPLDTSGLSNAIRPRSFVITMGRLKARISLTAAVRDLDDVIHGVLAENAARARGEANYSGPSTVRLMRARDFLLSIYGVNVAPQVLWLVGSAALLLLLIGCSNVVNLLFARAIMREREMGVRSALGATRSRLIQQLLAESLVLSVAGCAGGCLLASVALEGVAALLPRRGIASETEIVLNTAALAFAIATSIVTTVGCALSPALHASRTDVLSQLATASKSAGGGARRGRLRATLVIVEVALSIILLVGAGLMTRSLIGLTRIDLGFDPSRLLIAAMIGVDRDAGFNAQRKPHVDDILRRIRGLPGVVDAAATTALPGFGSPASDVAIPGLSPSDPRIARIDATDDRLFTTLGVRLLRGRAINATDVENARRVAVVNQAMVRQFFAASDPIGRSLVISALSRTDPFEVVGVSADVKNFGPRLPASPMAYVPYTAAPRWLGAILVRSAVPPAALLTQVRRQVWAVVPNLAIDAQTIGQARQRLMYETPEFGAAVMGAVATLGLVLAALGVFSVMAYAVSLRTHEFGIRMALGADPRDILQLIMSNGLTLVAAGALAGTIAALAAGRVIESQLFGVSATDFATFAAVIGVILLVGSAACLLAARRAMSMEPLDALRAE